jgi:hypothetical protein
LRGAGRPIALTLFTEPAEWQVQIASALAVHDVNHTQAIVWSLLAAIEMREGVAEARYDIRATSAPRGCMSRR